jgi:hypothetical protein
MEGVDGREMKGGEVEDPEDFWYAIQWCEEVGYYFENSWNELQVVLTEVRRNLRAEEQKQMEPFGVENLYDWCHRRTKKNRSN